MATHLWKLASRSQAAVSQPRWSPSGYWWKMAPLRSPSGYSGEPVPFGVREIELALGPGVDLFIDGGVLPRALPSTVVDVSEPVPRLIREGVVSYEDLKRIVPIILR